MFDVICLGSATVDIFLTIHERLKSVSYGSKVLVKDLEMFTGGGGTNAAVALSKLGLKTAFLGKFGADHNAELIKTELKKEKVVIIKTAPSQKHRTSLSAILKSDQEKDRVIYTYKGASDDLDFKNFNLLKTKWVYLGTLLNQSFKTAEKIVDYCNKNNIKVLFNPSTYLAKKGSSDLKTILKNTNILILNKSEAKLLLGNKNTNISSSLKKLKQKIKDIVIITDGPKTLYAYDGKQIYSIDPYQVKIVHTAGAGDAFNSGFLAGLIKTNSIETALKYGLAESASVIQLYGTKNGLLTDLQIQKFIRSHKTKTTRVII